MISQLVNMYDSVAARVNLILFQCFADQKWFDCFFFYYFLDYFRDGAKDFAILFNSILTKSYRLSVTEFGTYGKQTF